MENEEIKKRGTKKKFQHCGGLDAFNRKIKVFDAIGVRYTMLIRGSIREIHYGNHVLRFSLNRFFNRKVGSCCNAVIRQARNFTKEHGPIERERKGTYFRNPDSFIDFFMRGGRDIVSVDVKACYWAIAFNAGIINDDTYYRYLEDKELRLWSIGNLSKPTLKEDYLGGRNVKGTIKVFPNENEWVWDYVVYEAYELFEKINKAINGEVFVFKTDCVYADIKHREAIEQAISDNDFQFKSEKLLITGYNKGKIVVKRERGTLRSISLGCPMALKSSLPIIPEDQLENKRKEKKEKKSTKEIEK